MKSIKANSLIVSLIFAILIGGYLPHVADGKNLQFNLVDGLQLTYELEISSTQKNYLESQADDNSYTANLRTSSRLLMRFSIEVVENQQDEYARLICRYDSLSDQITISEDSIDQALRVDATKDLVKVYQNDSLISIFSSGNYNSGPAEEFYQRLLFVGEDITMLVYPSGEILNISENKNLWEMAQEFLGYPDEGFLQIIFPDISSGQRSSWEQLTPVTSIGDFRLKDNPQSLRTSYSIASGTETSAGYLSIKFNGDLILKDFSTAVGNPDFSDELRLETDYTRISKSGQALFIPHRGIVSELGYDLLISGDLKLSGIGLNDYRHTMTLESNTHVAYRLIDFP